MGRQLTARRDRIARGVTEMPLDKVLRLRAHWEADGYDIPPIEGDEEELRGLGDLIHKGLELIGIRQTEGCGCQKRQAFLNKLIPFKKSQDAVLPPDDRREEN